MAIHTVIVLKIELKFSYILVSYKRISRYRSCYHKERN